MISTYLFGKDIVTEELMANGDIADVKTEHIAGIFERIWNWSQKDGETLIDNITRFFSESWYKISRFLFGEDSYNEQTLANGDIVDVTYAGHKNGLIDNITAVFETLKTAYLEFSGWAGGAGNAAKTVIMDFLFGEADEKTNERSGGFVQAVATWYEDNHKDIEEIFTVKLPELFNLVNETLLGKDTIAYAGENEDGPIYDVQHVDGFLDPMLRWINGEGAEKLQEILDFFDSLWGDLSDKLFGYDTTHNSQSTRPRKHVDGLFDNVMKWIQTDGASMWRDIGVFLHGKDILDAEGNVVRHDTGVFEEIQAFLDPIYQWIVRKGERIYDYLTTHDFEEMWADLDTFLFGAKDLSDPEGKKRVGKGALSPLQDVLEPISTFISENKERLLTTIGKIDFSEVWNSIRRFFLGYDIAYEEIEGVSGDKLTNSAGGHVDGLFEKLEKLIDRIIGFFESDTWKGIKKAVEQFYNQFIKPVTTFFGGTFGTLIEALNHWDTKKSFFENLLNVFTQVKTYATSEFPTLIDTMLGGIDLEGIIEKVLPDWLKTPLQTYLPGLYDKIFPKTESADTPKTSGMSLMEQRFGGKIKPEQIIAFAGGSTEGLGRLIGAASNATKQNLDEATDEANKQSKEVQKKTAGLFSNWDLNWATPSNGIMAIAGQAEYTAEKATDAQSSVGLIESVFMAIGELFSDSSNLSHLINIIFAAVTLKNIKDLTEALTGKQKDSFIQDIADLFDAFGGLFEKLALLLAVVTGSELLSGGNSNSLETIKTVFGEVRATIRQLFTMFAVIGLGGSGLAGRVLLAHHGLQFQLAKLHVGAQTERVCPKVLRPFLILSLNFSFLTSSSDGFRMRNLLRMQTKS